MTRPRAADDFAAIRARLEELQRERAKATRREQSEEAINRRLPPRNRFTIEIEAADNLFRKRGQS